MEKLKPTIGMITNDRKSATRSIKDLITEAHHLPDLPDDAYEGMLVDDAFYLSLVFDPKNKRAA